MNAVLSPQTRRNLERVFIITIAYIVINVILTLLAHYAIYSNDSLGPSPRYSLYYNLMLSLISGASGGLLGGSLLIRFYQRSFRGNSFRRLIAKVILLFSSIFIVLTLLIGSFTVLFLADENSHGSFSHQLSEVLSRQGLHVYYFLWSSITVFTIFMLQMSDKFGPGVMGKFLRGNYLEPKSEDRIFMFLDMKSSTTLAEKMGNKNYFHFLRDCFSDITPAIIAFRGEIYQYVGDEIVISWEKEKGFANANALRCFDAICKRLAELANNYRNTYGAAPSFKAGMHCGQVMAGEIGDIKKDIVYSGDVLNTAARIQSLCNEYRVDLLISGEVLEGLGAQQVYAFKRIGEIELKGKQTKIELHAIAHPEALVNAEVK